MTPYLSDYRFVRWFPASALWPRKRPDGSAQCRWCEADVPRGRRSWCSAKCVNDFLMRSSAQHVRNKLMERDRGVCAHCGIDADAIEQAKCDFRRDDRDGYAGTQYATWYLLGQTATRESWGPWLSARHGRQTWWDAHHVIAVEDGGGCCGLENYVTLCLRCHKSTLEAK